MPYPSRPRDPRSAIQIFLALVPLLLAGCQSVQDRSTHRWTHPGFESEEHERQGREPRQNIADTDREDNDENSRTPLPPREDSPGEWVEYQLARRLPEGVGQLPMDTYSRALRHKTAMRHDGGSGKGQGEAKSSPADWEWLGPANIAGRGQSIAFDPRNPDRIYTGGVSGGVWLSEDAGEHWSPLSDGAENINIGSLVVDPVEPDTIFAGTGELYRNTERPYAAMWGQGILRSRDGGRHFQQLLATASDDFRYVADLAISPHDHRRIYAATNSGLWLSRDGGASFEQLLKPETDGGGPLYEGCTDISIRPDAAGDDVLVSCSSRSTADRYWLPGPVTPAPCSGAPCPAAIYRNPDAAADGSWSIVLSEAGMGRTSIAFAPSQPEIVYAVAASLIPGFDRNGDGQGDYNNGLHALWRSIDGGITWTTQLRNSSTDALSTYLFSYADGMEALYCDYGDFFNYGAGWYNQAIAVDPLQPDSVWVAGMDLYRSDDGGRHFGKASYWFLAGAQIEGIHADQHALAFHPGFDGETERRLYSVNDGGVWVTSDARGSVSTGRDAACGPIAGALGWQPLIDGLGTVQYYSGTTSANGERILAGAQDNGTHLLNAGDGDAGWQHVFGGDGANVAVDPRDPDRFYVSYQGIHINRTEDGGQTFTPVTTGLIDATLFIMPYLLDPNVPDDLWAGGRQVWLSSNRGDSWRPVSALFGTSFNARISALAVQPGNSNRVLAANRDGIFRSDHATSSNGSTPWPSTSPRGGWVSSLDFDPSQPDVVYATYSTFGGVHVWRSNDAGISWFPLDGDGDGALPDIAVHTLAVDPTDSRRLVIGTDLGVFVSTDAGGHWAVENNGFANAIVEKLHVTSGGDSGAPMLYAFTYGRGAWRVPLAQLNGSADYRIGDDSSGALFDPANPGHGWIVESIVQDGVRLLAVGWYAYENGQQLWLLGLAPISGDTVTLPMYRFDGGQFPPAFDPADVQPTPWGELTLHYDDANRGQAHWHSTLEGFSEGDADWIRLTGISDSSEPDRLSGCHSGSWFDPEQSGHGLQVQIVDDGNGGAVAVAIWYHYLDGQPAWVLGTGPVEGDHADIDMSITRGAGFPPQFDPAAVETLPWGPLHFSIQGANAAHVDWTSEYDGYGDGSLDLIRLTGLAGHACSPAP